MVHMPRFSCFLVWVLSIVVLLLSMEGGSILPLLQAAESPPPGGRQRKSHDMLQGESRGRRMPTTPRRSKRRESIPLTAQDPRMMEGGPRTNFRIGGRSKFKQRRASELIQTQEQPMVIPRVLSQAAYQRVSILISLSRQRAYLKIGEEIAIDAPICSGKAAGMTPRGHFTILQKDPDHRSSIYGDFVDRNGQIVRAGVSLKIDSAPSGTTYVGASMRWFMRLTSGGIGMHAGYLPGYPASHGCIRLPETAAKLMYDCVKIGTLVVVGE